MTASPDCDAEVAVDVRELTRRFGTRTAVDGVSLSVARGKSVALLGPNGSGKTTLFRMLATLLPPTSGAALICGADVAREPARVRGFIGVVFQHPSLDGKLTVVENLRHHGHLYRLSGAELRRRIEEALVRFQLLDRGGERVDRLSGGLHRRVELAKVMLHRPAVLLLDEPSTGLDPAARRVLFEYLAECQGRDAVTTLLTTHLMDEADRCDVVAILDHGRIVAIDHPGALKNRLSGDVVTVTASDVANLKPRIEARFSVSAVVAGTALHIERPRGHEFVPQLVEAFPGEIESVTVGKPTLEDVFLHLTGRRLHADSGAVEG